MADIRDFLGTAEVTIHAARNEILVGVPNRAALLLRQAAFDLVDGIQLFEKEYPKEFNEILQKDWNKNAKETLDR